MEAARPISRISLHDQVIDRLRTMLVVGEVPPGAKLNERELSERLGVSRTPLREAIKLLAAEGMVDLVPRRGAIATKLTSTDVVNAFEVLATLEGMVGELAAQRITEPQLNAVRSLHSHMAVCFAREDLPGYYRFNAEIHKALAESTANDVLISACRSINTRLQSVRFRTNLDRSKWQRAMAEHDEMLEALEARDGQRLRDLLVAHINRKRDNVLEFYRANENFSSLTPR